MSLDSSSFPTETAIWERVIRPDRGDLPADAARFFLNLSFDESDLDRMQQLAVKNQDGTLSPDEAAALHSYRQVALQIDLLRSKARLTMQQHSA
jgi:hypothetical protein